MVVDESPVGLRLFDRVEVLSLNVLDEGDLEQLVVRHISDNNGYDWQFINWYFHHFTGENPFGFSSMNLGSFYKGLVGDTSKTFKHLRKTEHTHDPVDDALGNAEAFLAVIEQFTPKIRL